jgi:hypothetical protein
LQAKQNLVFKFAGAGLQGLPEGLQIVTLDLQNVLQVVIDLPEPAV